MPYKIKKVKGGFKVTNGTQDFSKKPLSKAVAEKQLLAITIPVAKKYGGEPNLYWA